MGWQKRVQEVGGSRVSYAVAGQGPPVTLVHGVGACHVTWCENIGPLSRHYTVYALDLPGHGDSESPPASPSDRLAHSALLGGFMDGLIIERASLVGNSGGGSMAALFAIHNPRRVGRLVLLDSGGLGRPVSWFLRVCSLPLVGKLLHLHTLNSDRALIASIFHRLRPLDPEVVRELRRARNAWETRVRVVRAIRSGINLLEARKETLLLDQLRRLKAPLLVVWGEKDPVLPVPHARDAARKLPDALVHIVPDCGHWPHMEDTQEFNRVLLAFLEDPERAKESLGWARPES